jgi:hypothetical protein
VADSYLLSASGAGFVALLLLLALRLPDQVSETELVSSNTHSR